MRAGNDQFSGFGTIGISRLEEDQKAQQSEAMIERIAKRKCMAYLESWTRYHNLRPLTELKSNVGTIFVV